MSADNNNSNETETWLILGASSSIARAFADQAAGAGCRIILAGRDLDDLQATASDIKIRHGTDAQAVIFDATDYESHPAFANRCVETSDGVLNILLAFGFMPTQAITDGDFSAFRTMAETNYLGAVSILDRFAPLLEQQGTGRVIVVGSVAAERGRLKNYAYGSTKAALHTYTAGLRARLYRAGVSVTTVVPGFVDTTMTWGLPGLMFMASPEELASGMWRAGDKRAEIVHLRRIWALVMLVIRSIPERIFKRLDI